MTVGSQSSHTKRNEAEKWPPAGQSVGSVHVGDRTYPLVSESRCKTCMSPNRLLIETAIVKGAGYVAVADRYKDEAIPARGIKRHFRRGHLPLLADAVHKLKTEEAERRGQIVDEAATNLATLLHVARLIVGKVYEDVVLGKVHPTLRDGIQFSKLLLEADGHAADVDWMVVDRGFTAFLAIAEALMDNHAYEELTQRVTSHPDIGPLQDRRKR